MSYREAQTLQVSYSEAQTLQVSYSKAQTLQVSYSEAQTLQVSYNGAPVFPRAAAHPTAAVTRVDWVCSEEFEASASSPVAFVGGASFMAFNVAYPRRGGELRLQLRTTDDHALIMYAAGPSSR